MLGFFRASPTQRSLCVFRERRSLVTNSRPGLHRAGSYTSVLGRQRRCRPGHGREHSAALHVVLALGNRPGHPAAFRPAGYLAPPRRYPPAVRFHAGPGDLQRGGVQYPAVPGGDHNHRYQYCPDQRHYPHFRGTAGLDSPRRPHPADSGAGYRAGHYRHRYRYCPRRSLGAHQPSGPAGGSDHGGGGVQLGPVLGATETAGRTTACTNVSDHPDSPRHTGRPALLSDGSAVLLWWL